MTLTDVSTVLDVGCGNGRFATFLRETGYSDIAYSGFDSEESFVHKAQERNSGCEFHVATIETELDSARNVDLAVCFGVFHQLPEQSVPYRRHLGARAK
jgi:trans-aconitate methyltransferase